MESIGVFVTIMLIVLGFGLVFAVAAVFLVNGSTSWWDKL